MAESFTACDQHLPRQTKNAKGRLTFGVGSVAHDVVTLSRSTRWCCTCVSVVGDDKPELRTMAFRPVFLAQMNLASEPMLVASLVNDMTIAQDYIQEVEPFNALEQPALHIVCLTLRSISEHSGQRHVTVILAALQNASIWNAPCKATGIYC